MSEVHIAISVSRELSESHPQHYLGYPLDTIWIIEQCLRSVTEQCCGVVLISYTNDMSTFYRIEQRVAVTVTVGL